MNLKHSIIILLLLISNQILSQIVKNDFKKIERFCCYEWLPEFKDSILVIVDERKVNQRKRYCVLTKGKRRNYNLHCWTGSKGLETPTEWRDKLKIRFKRDIVFLKFGKERIEYRVSKLSKEEYLLIKMKK